MNILDALKDCDENDIADAVVKMITEGWLNSTKSLAQIMRAATDNLIELAEENTAETDEEIAEAHYQRALEELNKS